MQRFNLTLEFPDLKPQQWTRLRVMAEEAVREDSGGESGLDDATDGWDLGYWLFRLILGGHCVMYWARPIRSRPASSSRTRSTPRTRPSRAPGDHGGEDGRRIYPCF
jgi:hypothetical protein